LHEWTTPASFFNLYFFLDEMLLHFFVLIQKNEAKKVKTAPASLFLYALFLDEKCQKSRLRLLRSKN